MVQTGAVIIGSGERVRCSRALALSRSCSRDDRSQSRWYGARRRHTANTAHRPALLSGSQNHKAYTATLETTICLGQNSPEPIAFRPQDCYGNSHVFYIQVCIVLVLHVREGPKVYAACPCAPRNSIRHPATCMLLVADDRSRPTSPRLRPAEDDSDSFEPQIRHQQTAHGW